MIGINLRHRDPPGFHIRDANLDDVEALTQLWYDSFHRSHKFLHYATPDDAETREWLNEVWTMGIQAGPEVLRTFVVEDLNEGGRLAAFCRIHVPQLDGNQDIPMPELPAGHDLEIADALWGGMARNRAAIMGKQLHWMGEFLGVDAPYQKRGLATPLLDWICQQADATGLEIYIDATAVGIPIYEKHYGFRPVKRLEMPKRPGKYDSYAVVAMVRPPLRPVFRSRL
ncbi:unnamed protein product [Clonostachys rosea f. rosea IK726]|uniref:N-acetyltransferase domain-containing protein n=3 Tax=Bionectria ochroleuca TaxID=29856 RepID=A0A0B7KKG4_BIOOC|nr:unnamed protein product [Clonostachys rosea f. rosea IK726]